MKLTTPFRFGAVHRGRWLLAITVLAVLATACEYDPAAFENPALSQCDGVDATIGIGFHEPTDGPNGAIYEGTVGDDVVVITNGPVSYSNPGGSDLICVNDIGLLWGGASDCAPEFGAFAVCVGDYCRDGCGPETGEPDTFYGSPKSDFYVSFGADTVMLGGDDDLAIVDSTATVDCGDGQDKVIYLDDHPPATTNCETVTDQFLCAPCR